jgi:hypothetical protein
MKSIYDTKQVKISIDAQDLLLLLNRLGYVHPDLSGEDVQLMRIDSSPGSCSFHLVLGGDSLPDATKYRGYCVDAGYVNLRKPPEFAGEPSSEASSKGTKRMPPSAGTIQP